MTGGGGEGYRDPSESTAGPRGPSTPNSSTGSAQQFTAREITQPKPESAGELCEATAQCFARSELAAAGVGDH